MMKGKILFYLLLAAWVLSSCSDDEACVSVQDAGATSHAVSVPLTRAGDECSIGNDNQQLLFSRSAAGYTTTLVAFGQRYRPQDEGMVRIQVWNADLSASTDYTVAYDSVLVGGDGQTLVAYATATSAAGSVFAVTDTYSTAADRPSLCLQRKIVVSNKAPGDRAFNSLLLLRPEQPLSITAGEYYVPALVFKDGSNMSDAAIGTSWTDEWILAREERMGLPLAMMRDKNSGVALSLCDYNLNPTTNSSDWGNTHLVAAIFKYASLGFQLQGDAPALAFCYPGCEGERSYSDGGSHAERLWARRSTMLSKNQKQEYTVHLLATRSASFAEALRDHWRAAFDLYSPELLDVDAATVLDASLEVLDHYWLKSGNAPGFPFSVYCADGKVCETSFDMGFVGMQAACGYYLYRYGLDHGLPAYRKKGEQVLDFWANHSANADGMPRIWYDIDPWNSFRNYNDLRNMQGGLEAMILAWSCAEAARPGSHANWLRYCKRAADWLVARQAADGSLPKAFDNGGAVVDAGTYLTSCVIRFLTAMYGVTAKPAYRNAAVKAAEWCLKNIHADYKYIGSVIDNPYVKDRESGQKMIEAMLAAYDLTGDGRYLEAAQQAAYYTVSYMYAWNIPWETGTSLAMPWPKKKSTVGITIIATGHSGADCGFAYNSFEYLRLYELTHDPYFLSIARLLEKNTKQTMNYDGSLRYPWRGLQREAIRCVTHRGDGVALWLPWCTAAHLDPIFRTEDAYGVLSADDLFPVTTSAPKLAPTPPKGECYEAPKPPLGGVKALPLDSRRYARKLGMVRLPDGKVY